MVLRMMGCIKCSEYILFPSCRERERETHTHTHTQSFGNGANEDGGIQKEFEDREMEARRVAWIS
jgi:hypothetical protein